MTYKGNTYDRSYMFDWLPGQTPIEPADAALNAAPYYNAGQPFSINRWNQYRKYGSTWESQWANRAKSRLASWGMNTIACWSQKEYNNGSGIVDLYNTIDFPSTPRLSTRNALKFKVYNGPASQNQYTEISDPFDPNYEARLKSAWAGFLYPNNPWIIGYFIDNELPFSRYYNNRSLVMLGRSAFLCAAGTLGDDGRIGGQYAKERLVKLLQTKYATPTDLEVAWGLPGTAFTTSWSSVYQSTLDLYPYIIEGNAVFTDLRDFLKIYAKTYFRDTRAALKTALDANDTLYDPNHLYLGSRFSELDPDVVKEAANYVDVISVNMYVNHLDDTVMVDEYNSLSTPTLRTGSRVYEHTWKSIMDDPAIDKPFLISEFSFNSYSRNLPGMYVEHPNETARANAYASFLQEIHDQKNIVGAHFYQYMDQLPYGEAFAMENCGHGLLDITDMPYPEMIAKTRAYAPSMYTH